MSPQVRNRPMPRPVGRGIFVGQQRALADGLTVVGDEDGVGEGERWPGRTL